MIPRRISPLLKKSNKSILLLGPRQTGKSTLVSSFQTDLKINLAHEMAFLEFSRNPLELEQRIKGTNARTIFIDEVQRLPNLLNTVQALIDESAGKLKFFLTGSSARKLRRGKANLLPGRIHAYHLAPLASMELDYRIDTQQCLQTGSLPGIYTDPDEKSRQKTLRSYCATYLKEEIQAEALARNIEGFARFLHVAAAHAGQYLDLAKFASEAQVPRQSAVRFFEILEDTLLVHRCESFAKSARRRLLQHPRYFFFDTGVLNGVLGNFHASEDRKGPLFEHFFFNQLINSAYAGDVDLRISSYRTSHGAEVDFIIEINDSLWAVEIKASQSIGRHDLRGMKSFSEYYGKKHFKAVAYMGKDVKRIEEIDALPWQLLIKKMGL
ncbi:MAG: ATP-binding protein [Nitrospinae bacterium]|nr:ATP-binding protein [Nitrospinota bacterium]